MALNATTAEQMSESGEKVAEIQALTAEAQDLARSAGQWNNAYVILVALTVLLAAGLFITQFIAIGKGRKLEEVQGKLMAAKDAKAALDSKEKDVKIAQAGMEASVAIRAAAEAREGTATALTKAATANERSIGLTLKVEEESSKRVAAEREIESLKTEGEKIKAAAERDRLTRVQLEQSIKRRTIKVIIPVTFADLALFSGTPAGILFLHDVETRRLTGDIDVLLRWAKWRIERIEVATPLNMAPAAADLNDGVRIWTWYDQTTGVHPWVVSTPAMRAARVLAHQLKAAHGIEARVEGPTIGGRWPAWMPKDGVLILVGFKPEPYFEEQDSAKITEMMRKNMEPWFRQRMEEQDRRLREMGADSLEREGQEVRRFIEEQRRLRSQGEPGRP